MATARKSGSRRGATLVESALALMVFGVLMAGVMELGFTGFIDSSVTFAAQRAARYAAVRGSGSGHPATVADIRAIAQSYAAPLSTAYLTVTTTWTPNNNPGSTVLVTVSYAIRPALLPISAGVLTLQSAARQTITQ
ncbi:MAG: TadE/TadG family type IV pilus assembly protein [Candidatus Solibacter sp.]